MCGIAGIARTELSADAARGVLVRASDRLRHRGPDGDGHLWHDRDRLGLAHRRLAVVDLSPGGAQPMESASGAHAVVFNGELFNAVEVAKVLQASGWRPKGRSDTEVLLAAVEAWGVEAALGRFVGMFAIALHDRVRRTLHLVRDRVGIKPLHWAWIPQRDHPALAFASELRALLEVPGFDQTTDPAAVASMLAHGCVTGERSIWRGARKLAPGHRLELDLVTGRTSISCWWSAIAVANHGIENPFRGTDEDAVERGAELLDGVVREHLVSDVPLGCFLSGGIDSASVAAAAREAQRGAPLAAFTAGFDVESFDERADAARMAGALGMPVHELPVREGALVHAVMNMAEVHDEPFADSSQVPTWLLCGAMRGHVKVALSGDGGDEIFGGYHRHVHAANNFGRGRLLPPPLRGALGGAVRSLSPEAWNSLLAPLLPLLPARLRARSIGDSMHKWSRCLDAKSDRAAYEALTDVRGESEGEETWWRDADAARLPDPLRRFQFMDQTGYLVDDILVKVDRASMAHGLEVRVPLLDHRVIEFAWSLPPRMKVRHGRGKWLLRRLLARRVASNALRAPKRGFAVPLGRWLRGPLHEWASDLLAPARIRGESALDAERVERSWSSLQAGSDAAQHELWCVLMLLAWTDRWGATA